MRTALCLAALFAASTASAMTTKAVYWTNNESKIEKYHLATATVSTVNVSVGNPWGIALDDAAGKMYFTEAIYGFGRVSRTDLDGSNRETFLNNQVNPQDIAVDPAGGKMYWSSLDGKIQRANLDGTSVETFATIALYPAGLFVDGVNNKLYWSLSSPGSIHRANLDGTGIETLPLNVGLDPGDLAFDATTNKVYWTERGGHKIVRGNVDGTSQEDLVSLDVNYFPDGLDLDLAAGKVYWSAGGWISDRIQRANLDGSAVETVYEDLNEIYPYPGSTVFRHIALSFVPEPSGLHIVAAATIAGPLGARKRRCGDQRR